MRDHRLRRCPPQCVRRMLMLAEVHALAQLLELRVARWHEPAHCGQRRRARGQRPARLRLGWTTSVAIACPQAPEACMCLKCACCMRLSVQLSRGVGTRRTRHGRTVDRENIVVGVEAQTQVRVCIAWQWGCMSNISTTSYSSMNLTCTRAC